MKNLKRVYVLEHTMMTVQGNPMEPIIAYYDFSERQEFINQYMRRKDEWYTIELKAYYADLKEIDVDQMINAV